ncbi:hypothetical protein [Edaphobacter sp.]|uniref:hypothetical protein n=1 Tax=Edaphobacter sp. TaxID=1934404 RepID=UPI002DB9C73C|nr:hypothetical protein [Edaphobacter sp.]HEU5342311.1 hypothetical protein [Edaphobacter sp.]
MNSSSVFVPAARSARREIVPGVRLLLALCVLCGISPWVASAQNQQSSSSASQAGTAEVIIKNFRFQPAQVTVHPGEAIEFKNEDILLTRQLRMTAASIQA